VSNLTTGEQREGLVRKILLVVFLAAALSGGCSSNSEGLPAFEQQQFYLALQDCAAKFLDVSGQWMEDFDDGAFYGPAFFAWAGKTEGNQDYLDLAAAAETRNLGVIRTANLLTGDVNLIVMAALGTVEYMAATGEREGLSDLDGLVSNMIDLVGSFGWYVTPDLSPGYAMETYGPTAINGLMVLLPLQRALQLEGADHKSTIDFAEKVLARIDERSWNGKYYEFDDGVSRPGLYLYPNITMIILNARLFQLTKTASYRARALDVYNGMQPLKVTLQSGLAAPGRYRSPYSAEHMGATTDDYSTLSSQNYLMLSLMLLYQLSGDVAFIKEADSVLGFLNDFLWGQSCLTDIHLVECDPACDTDQACLKMSCFDDSCHCGVLHHWMDGRLAQPADPEFFCSGCNLQLLYIMWYRQNML